MQTNDRVVGILHYCPVPLKYLRDRLSLFLSPLLLWLSRPPKKNALSVSRFLKMKSIHKGLLAVSLQSLREGACILSAEKFPTTGR